MPTNSFTLTSDASVQSPPFTLTSDASVQNPPFTLTSDAWIGTGFGLTSDAQIVPVLLPSTIINYPSNATIAAIIFGTRPPSPCVPCCAMDVEVPNDFDYGYQLYATQAYSFVLDCPSDLFCPPGYFPVTVTIPPTQIPPVIVPPGATVLTMQGCSSLITASIPAGANSTQIAAIVAGMQQQWAYQQAWCNVRRNIPKQPKQLTLPTACANTSYSQPITPLTGSGPYDLSIVSGILPYGLSLTQTGPTSGLLSGITTDTGATVFTVRATNLAGQYGDVTYTLTVMGLSNLSGLTSGNVTTPFSFVFDSDGGTGPYTYGISGGALPDGLTLAGDGTLSGTPTTPGDFTFTVQITDSAGHKCNQSVTVSIAGVQYVTPDIFSGTLAVFSQNLDAGLYRIAYVNGALKYNIAQGWALNAFSINPLSGYEVVYSLGQFPFPGTSDASFPDQASVEAANTGAHIDIIHGGGPIGVFLSDTIYGDNVSGSPNPTFSLTKLA